MNGGDAVAENRHKVLENEVVAHGLIERLRHRSPSRVAPERGVREGLSAGARLHAQRVFRASLRPLGGNNEIHTLLGKRQENLGSPSRGPSTRQQFCPSASTLMAAGVIGERKVSFIFFAPTVQCVTGVGASRSEVLSLVPWETPAGISNTARMPSTSAMPKKRGRTCAARRKDETRLFPQAVTSGASTIVE